MSKELFEALQKHDLHRLSALLAGGANPDARLSEWPGWFALHAAIEELEHGGPIEALLILLRHGARVDGLPHLQDAPPLLMALFRRQPEAARMLLAAGADPNLTGSEGDSPLRWCVQHSERRMAFTLLACGATRTLDEPGAPDGMTALGLATRRLDVPLMELLLKSGAHPHALDTDRRAASDHLPLRTPENSTAWEAARELLSLHNMSV